RRSTRSCSSRSRSRPLRAERMPGLSNPYLGLTAAFNAGRLRTILSSGQEFSRSPRDILRLFRENAGLQAEVIAVRPALGAAARGEDALAAALDAERRELIRAHEKRLAAYDRASMKWRAAWPDVEKKMQHVPLRQAHAIMVREAESFPPFE